MFGKETTANQIKEHKNVAQKPNQINILCNQITFNPSEETITIIACRLQHKSSSQNHSKRERAKTQFNNNIKTNLSTKNSILPSHNQIENRQILWYPPSINVEDVICLGVVLFLFVIWVSVFTYYIFKDHATEHDADAKAGHKFEDDYVAQ